MSLGIQQQTTLKIFQLKLDYQDNMENVMNEIASIKIEEAEYHTDVPHLSCSDANIKDNQEELS